MRTVPAGWLAAALAAASFIAQAQGPGGEPRSRFVQCAAIFHAQGYLDADERRKAAYSRAGDLLIGWAAELVPAAQSGGEVVRAEMDREMENLTERMRKAQESTESIKAFDNELMAQDRSCQAFFGGEVGKRRPAERK